MMKRYVVLHEQGVIWLADAPRTFVGQSDSLHGAKIIKGRFLKDGYKHVIIVDTQTDDEYARIAGTKFMIPLAHVKEVLP